MINRDKLSPRKRTVIGVIGASSAEAPVLEIAESIGYAVGQTGWHLLTGGGGGVMEAACRGFIAGRDENGGLTIGILPSDEVSFANQYVELSIPTGLGWARNAIVARSSQGIVAVGGCAGTLSEIAFAWQMGRPIVALSSSGGWAQQLAGQAVDTRRTEVIYPAQDAADALAYLQGVLS